MGDMTEEEKDQLNELSKHYEFGPLWREDADRADANWKVVFQDVQKDTAYVEAEAKTGTRYAVFCTEMPYRVAPIHEATHIFALVHPWPRTMLLNFGLGDDLHLTYLREKLAVDSLIHGGDLTATALTMAHAVTILREKGNSHSPLKVTW